MLKHAFGFGVLASSLFMWCTAQAALNASSLGLAPAVDFDDCPRPQGCNGDGESQVDIGAYERLAGSLAPQTPTPSSTPTPEPPATATGTPGSSPFGPFPDGTTIFVAAANDGMQDGSALHPFATIQEAIDSAKNSAVVGVAAGTYAENVQMKRGVDLIGSGADVTTIDARGKGSGVRCGDQTRLQGFSVVSARGRSPNGFPVGAVDCDAGVSITISDMRIVDNDAIALRLVSASAIVRHNVLAGNPLLTASCPCDAIVVSKSTASIEDNLIDGTDRSGNISAIRASQGTGGLVVSANRITGRISVDLFSVSSGAARNDISNNIVVGGNDFSEAINVAFSPNFGRIANNTIVGTGGLLFQGGSSATIVSNIVAFGSDGVFGLTDDSAFASNDVFGNTGRGQNTDYLGPNRTGQYGNISKDPLFVDRSHGDFHLTCRSPAIDGGWTADAPNTDIDGNPRPFDAHGNGVADVDIGADEFVPDPPRPFRVWGVPGDFSHIQEAIDASVPCDTIMVQPGAFIGSLRLQGKDITLRSITGAGATIIQGDSSPVIDIGPDAELSGFTLTSTFQGATAGAVVHGSRTRITQCVFDGHAQGLMGIQGVEASPTVERSLFRQSLCDPSSDSAILSFTGGAPMVMNCIVAESTCTAVAFTRIRSGNAINNTIVANATGIRVTNRLPYSFQTFRNNILFGNTVGLEADVQFFWWDHNLLFGNGTNYTGIADQTGVDGNLSADPLFVNALMEDFHLIAGSPAVDAGSDSDAPTIDFDGNPRPADGDSDAIRSTDIGAYEFAAVPCDGDCDSSHQVTVDELVRLVGVALGTLPISACTAGDLNHDQTITVDELVTAVERALSGC
jgi:hypothetical protein